MVNLSLKSYLCIVIAAVSMVFTGLCIANNHAVILQYHHVSNATPSSTSVSPEQLVQHIQWLQANQFEVLPLPRVVDVLTSRRRFSTDKVAVMTFDDANISVCETAWPILKRYQIPFTLFISTQAVENQFKTQCSWEALREMMASGLMTPGNHSHTHLHMVSRAAMSRPQQWYKQVTHEVERAQALIVDNLGPSALLFAYPYGEFNTKLARLLTRRGYIGLGQHSGAIGYESDFSALPRFPVSGRYAKLESLEVKLLSLPFPAKVIHFTENPVAVETSDNPPLLTVEMTDNAMVEEVACFNSEGKPLPVERSGSRFVVQAPDKLAPGRHRYTCTRPSQSGRFFWMSHQWLVE